MSNLKKCCQNQTATKCNCRNKLNTKIAVSTICATNIKADKADISTITVDIINAKTIVSTNNTPVSSWQCNAGLGVVGIVDPPFGYGSRIISDVTNLNTMYGPYNTSKPVSKIVYAIPAIANINGKLRRVNIEHAANTIDNLIPNNMIHEICFALAVINPKPFADGSIAYLVGLDGTLIYASDYVAGEPNNLINAKDYKLTIPNDKFKTSFHNQSMTPAQFKYILDNQNDFIFPTTVTVMNPTDVATFFDLQSTAKTCYWVGFVTTYPPATMTEPAPATTLFKGTNTSIAANTAATSVFCNCNSGGYNYNSCSQCNPDDCACYD